MKDTTKQVAELTAEIEEMELSIKKLRDAIQEKEAAILELVASYRVGDRVIVTNYRNKEVVYEISRLSTGFARKSVRYYGKMIKKDGTLGKIDTDLSYFQMRKAESN